MKTLGDAETKHWSGAVPVSLLALSASATSADTLQELNPRPWLCKASVYHSATSAVHEVILANMEESPLDEEEDEEVLAAVAHYIMVHYEEKESLKKKKKKYKPKAGQYLLEAGI